ncbi:hypothetical protein [Shimia sediminis]|uniref:hypothetical protein n=1 Tax=Shimia sediminis TaxID=2497945 RepID=UPI000F8F61E0|nr:hypothetical protein [Shimia sediminis]
MTLLKVSEAYVAKHQASDLAYRLRSIIAVAYCAFDNDCGSIPMQQRGIDQTLELAESMANDLIDKCEELERAGKAS